MMDIQDKSTVKGEGLARRQSPRDLALLGGIALVPLLLHLLVIERYGFFRDELYYVACSDHLAWGYVDHPPLSIAILAGVRAVLGDSLFALRLLPALANALGVFLTGCIARELGGGRYAQALAALAAATAPVYLASSHFFSMNAFDMLFWTVAAYVLVRTLKAPDTGRWLTLGAIVGLALLNKISILWFGLGLGAGLLLTPHRRTLATGGPWMALALAIILFLPHGVWQVQHGWPTREFIHNATTLKMAEVSPPEFFLTQVMAMNPLAAPVWLTGLFYCFFSPSGRPWRVLGWIWVVVAAILLASGTSRANYLSPAYPLLLAPGAVALERFFDRGRPSWLRALPVHLVLAGGAVALPMALPVLPVEHFIAYVHALGWEPSSEEKGEPGVLPQHYADMFGWPELTAIVAGVYDQLPSEDRQRCAIFTENYGEAGAIDFFGGRYSLPKAISGHNNYWLWGPRGWTGEVVIIVGGDLKDHRQALRSVHQAATAGTRYSRPEEKDLPIYVGRRLKMTVDKIWPTVKSYR